VNWSASLQHGSHRDVLQGKHASTPTLCETIVELQVLSHDTNADKPKADI